MASDLWRRQLYKAQGQCHVTSLSSVSRHCQSHVTSLSLFSLAPCKAVSSYKSEEDEEEGDEEEETCR